MKISVITPTYNDAVSIKDTYISLKSQTFENWEWIVINDGSSDNTNEVIKALAAEDKSNRIIYKEQQNQDQLNAIIHAAEYITGDFVFTLHSDDMLPSETFFCDCLSFIEKNPDADGIYGDLVLINENGTQVGVQKLKNYKTANYIPPLQLLWLGRNLYSDVAFHKTEIFKNQVLKNYLIWNTPLWLDFKSDSVKMLNYKKASFPVLKYRVHQGNYINNELGKLNVINGELRTAVKLMRYYSIPFYRIQYFLFRLFNKLGLEYKPIYFNKETKHKAPIVKFIIQIRYGAIPDNMFLKSIYGFFNSSSGRTLTLNNIPRDLKIYYGKDIRAFNRKLLSGELEKFYTDFMYEMEKGFKAVAVSTPDDLQAVKDILGFFCIENTDCLISPVKE